MAITQTQIDALEKAIVSGHLTVEYEDRRVTYRSMAELKEAYDFARQAAGLVSADSTRVSRASFSRE
jgi:hypothetical protein